MKTIPAGRQKELFGEMLGQSLEEECSFDVVQAVHEQLSERMTIHKESKDPEPLTITDKEMGDILENSGVSPRPRSGNASSAAARRPSARRLRCCPAISPTPSAWRSRRRRSKSASTPSTVT